MNVSVIIVNFNGLYYTRQCLESIFRFHSSDALEVIVVDNNSTDGSQIELPKLFPSINFISLEVNKGFGAANNAGAKKAKGEFLFFVNNDTIFIEETVEELRKLLLRQSDYGIVGPRLLNEDRTFQISFGNFPTVSNEFNAKRTSRNLSLQSKEQEAANQSVQKDWITGAALMMKNELFKSVGGFDDQYFMYFEDIDLCRKLCNKDFKSMYIPSINLVHLGGKSYGKKDGSIIYEYRRSQLRYYDKHNSFIQRVMLRFYIVFKFLPKLFDRVEDTSSINILKLCFSTYN